MKKITEILILIIGGITMIIGLLSIGVGLYIIPALVFDWNYELPAIASQFVDYLTQTHGLSGSLLGIAVILPFIICGILLLFISRYASSFFIKKRKDENEEVQSIKPIIESTTVPSPSAPKKSVFGSIHPLIKLLAGIVLILFLLWLAEYLLTISFHIF